MRHHLYHKTLKRTSTFMAHDENGAKRGDRVRIVETRPLSKSKRWRVVEVVNAPRHPRRTPARPRRGEAP